MLTILTIQRGYRPSPSLPLDMDPTLIYHELKKTFRRYGMKVRTYLVTGLFIFVCAFMFAAGIASAQKKMPDTVTLKLEGGAMAPVTFSHTTHTQKAKISCVVCHHKDNDPKEAQACGMCHQATGAKDSVPSAKDAFHKKCQTCHKESAAKGVKAPLQCTECHKK
jgi:hypothetical protein